MWDGYLVPEIFDFKLFHYFSLCQKNWKSSICYQFVEFICAWYESLNSSAFSKREHFKRYLFSFSLYNKSMELLHICGKKCTRFCTVAGVIVFKCLKPNPTSMDSFRHWGVLFSILSEIYGLFEKKQLSYLFVPPGIENLTFPGRFRKAHRFCCILKIIHPTVLEFIVLGQKRIIRLTCSKEQNSRNWREY